MSRRRILVISYRDLHHPEMGGAEIIIHEIYRRLKAQGHEVTFLTCRFESGPDRDEIDGMEVIRVGNIYNFNFAAGACYRRHLRERGWSVIVEDLNKLPFYSPLFQKDVPVLVNIPHLFGTTVFSQVPWHMGLYVYLQEQTIPIVYRGCNFQVLSDSTQSDLIRRGISSERIKVVRSGIDHDYYVPPPRRDSPPGPVISYLGRLKKYKCIEHPIRVLRRLRDRVPGTEYWIVGEGDYRNDLARIAREEGVADAVRFLGFLSGAEKLDLLHRSRVLAYTSPKEGWGLSVIEAAATGVPSVASDSPGLRESVRHGATGYLVPHGNLAELHDRLLELLTNDAVWMRMSVAGLEWAGRFHWDRMAEETMALIEESVRRGRGNRATVEAVASRPAERPGADAGSASRSGRIEGR